MPVYADDLPYLFGLIAKGFGAKTSQEAEQEKRDTALRGLGQFFQSQQASYSQPQMARPNVGGMRGLTQPITPSSVNFNTVPTTPNPADFNFLSALINYSDLGGNANPFLQAAQSGQPSYSELAPGNTIVQRKGEAVKPVYTSPFKPPGTGESDWQDEYINGQLQTEKIPGTNATRVKQFKYQANPLTGQSEKIYRGAPGGTEPTGMLANAPLEKNSIEMVAQNYLMQGESALSAMGRNYVGRAQVIKRAAELAQQNGMDAQARQITKNLTKSVGASISNLTKQRDAVLAFEKTADKNLQIALDRSKRVDRTGSPIFNKWLLWTQGKAAGDPDVNAFDAAVHVAANEVAKVTSTTTGNLVPQQEREEYRNILNTALTAKGFEEVVNVLKQDMANRKTAYEEQLTEMRSNFPNIGGGGSVKFNLNGTQYNIPENEVEEFLKENPSAKRQ